MVETGGILHRITITVAALFATALLASAPPPAGAVPFTSITAFGDSLTDTGNIDALAFGLFPPSPPYERGRFSNGPVYADLLAQRYGLPLVPALRGGSNYAFGGATTGPGGFKFPGSLESPPSVLNQVDAYLRRPGGGAADPTGLYVVYGGGNDVREAARSADPAAAVGGAVANVGTAVRSLAAAGAQTILVPNLPNIGRTPEAIADGPAAVQALTALSQSFNTALATTLDGVAAAAGRPVTLVRLDVYSALEALVAAPGAAGFTNITDPCVKETLREVLFKATVCANPDTYLFWDQVHPTAAGHRVLADRAAAALQPAVAAPAGSGIPAAAPVGAAGGPAVTLAGFGGRALAAAEPVAVAEPATPAPLAIGLAVLAALGLWHKRARRGAVRRRAQRHWAWVRPLAARLGVALALAALAPVLARPSGAVPFSSMVVFGDSYSDNGNYALLSGGTEPGPPFAPGRFSNGPLFTERLAESYGLTLTPALQGGTNFAVAGARTGPADPAFPGSMDRQPSLLAQADAHLSRQPGRRADPNALYVVFGGINDLVAAVRTPDPDAVAGTAAATVATLVRDLGAAGARTVLVGNMPDLGLFPEARFSGPTEAAALGRVSRTFNTGLTAALNTLQSSAGAPPELIRLDIDAVVRSLAAPGAGVFANVTDTCLGSTEDGTGMTVCANPDAYLFWDAIHVTTATHRLLAQAAIGVLGRPVAPAGVGTVQPRAAAESVAEPATLAGLAAGLAGLAGLARRRRPPAAERTPAGSGHPPRHRGAVRTAWQRAHFSASWLHRFTPRTRLACSRPSSTTPTPTPSPSPR